MVFGKGKKDCRLRLIQPGVNSKRGKGGTLMAVHEGCQFLGDLA